MSKNKVEISNIKEIRKKSKDIEKIFLENSNPELHNKLCTHKVHISIGGENIPMRFELTYIKEPVNELHNGENSIIYTQWYSSDDKENVELMLAAIDDFRARFIRHVTGTTDLTSLEYLLKEYISQL